MMLFLKFFPLFFVWILTSCSLDASIESFVDSLPDSNLKTERTTTDFVAGEIVTTPSGAIIVGSFGEVSSRTILSNGTVIEGAFYE